MTKDEEATIKAEAARLGRPNPRTKADLSSLLLAVIAEREGKDASQSSEPLKNPVGRPAKLELIPTLLLSDIVSKSKAERGMSAAEACKEICEEGLEENGSPETLRKKIISLRTQRDKLVKDEKFKAKLLRECEDTLVMWLLIYCNGTQVEKSLVDAGWRLTCEAVDGYLGEGTTEAVIQGIIEKANRI